MEKRKTIDVNLMSQKTGIPVFKIKEALGLELSTGGFNFDISKSEEAKKLYEEINKEKTALMVSTFIGKNPSTKFKMYARLDEISEAEQKALGLWISFIEKVDDAVTAYFETKDGTKIQKLAYDKWNTLSIQDMKLANTIEDVQSHYYNTLESSPAEEFGLEKWDKLAKEQIDMAETFETIQDAYFKTVHDPKNEPRKEPEAKIFAIKKMINFARTEERAQWVYNEISFDVELENLALRNLISFFQ